MRSKQLCFAYNVTKLPFLLLFIMPVLVRSQSSISTDSVNKDALLRLYLESGKYYLSFTDEITGREILLIQRVIDAPASFAARGSILGNQQVIRFSIKNDTTVVLQELIYPVLDKMDEQQHAVDTITIASFNKHSKLHKQTIIDITNELLSGQLFNGIDSTTKEISIQNDNISIIALQKKDSSFIKTITNLLLLPSTPMTPRYYDERVGFHYSKYVQVNGLDTIVKNPVWRWRLQPNADEVNAYQQGKLVTPAKPVVFYIDPATPAKWVNYFIQGVEDWQPAFEKAGFKNAITAKLFTDSSINIMDARISAILYHQSNQKNATGKPGAVDPRSGEILETHIQWFSGMEQQLRDWYLVQAAVNDSAARTIHFDDSLMGRLVRANIAHEVGHALGLVHNVGGSCYMAADSLRNGKWIDANGITASIMDYVRLNYIAQPEDGLTREELIPHIGPYDEWAIDWGYHFFASDDNGVSKYPENLIVQKLKDKRYWYYREYDKDDPAAQTEDLSDDPVKASEYGIKNLQRVIKQLPKWVAEKDSLELGQLYPSIVNRPSFEEPSQYFSYIMHVVKFVDGKYTPRNARLKDSVNILPVTCVNQQQAMAFLNEQLFNTPNWLHNKEIMLRTGYDATGNIAAIQSNVLQLLLNRLLVMISDEANSERKHTGYTLWQTLSNGIWPELHDKNQPDKMKQAVQLQYLRLLCSPELNYGNVEIQKLIKNQLNLLQQQVLHKIGLSTKKSITSYWKKILSLLK